MKTFCLFLAISLFASFLYGQVDNFSITGSIKNSRKGSVAFLRYNNSKVLALDTSAIINGVFKFSGFIDEPRPAVLSIHVPGSTPDPQSILSIYIEPGEIMIGGRSTLSFAEVKGGLTNTENNALKKLLGIDKPVNNIPIPVSSRIVAVPAGSTPPQIPGSGGRPISGGNDLSEKKVDQIADQTRKTIKFIKTNPDSFVSLYSLQSLWANQKIDAKEFDSLLAVLSPRLIESSMGRVFFKK